ncbi:MAG: peptidylprolyl isomerase [Candidatus Micrarchaeia archaeon]
MTKVSKGDFIKIEYTGRTVSDNRVFDTTSAEVAKKEGIFDEKARYAPGLVVVGMGTVIKGLDEVLEGMEVGESKKVEVPPDKAFGRRDPNLVRVLPESEFKRRGIEPYPGQLVSIDNAMAVVKSVSSGRVMVDFNHLLAGETLSYEVKVVEKLTSLEQKINALLENNELRGKVKVDGNVVEVTFPAEIKKDADFLINKASFVANALRLLPEVESIRVIEEYAREERKVEKS